MRNLTRIGSYDLLTKFKIYNIFTLNLCLAHFLFYCWNGMTEAILLASLLLISLVIFYFTIQSYSKYYFYLLLVASQCIMGLHFVYHESNGIYFLLIPIFLGMHLILNTTSLLRILFFNLLIFIEILFTNYYRTSFDLKLEWPIIPLYFDLNALTLFAFCCFFWILFYQKFEIALFFRKQKQQQLLFFNLKEKLNDKETLQYLEDYRTQSPNLFVKLFYELFHELEELFTKNELELNYSERQLLAYFLLGFSYKEIAQYTKTTLKSIESRKYRLKHKLEQANLLFILNS